MNTIKRQKVLHVRSPFLNSSVYGVHGAIGMTGWKGLFTRRHFASHTEAVEWAHLPVSTVSGEHRHTRTEEIYLILEGEGEYFLNGKSCHAEPGFLALMTPGNTHGLRNVGKGHLNWWVIETITPETQAILAGQESISGSRKMLPRTVDMKVTPLVETAGTFEGPLKAVERHTLASGEEINLGGNGMETACFVNQGSGYLNFFDINVDILAPSSFLIPISEMAKFKSHEDTELFVVYLEVYKA